MHEHVPSLNSIQLVDPAFQHDAEKQLTFDKVDLSHLPINLGNDQEFGNQNKRNSNMESIHRQEYDREEAIKVLRLCKDDMYYHLLKPYKYMKHGSFDEVEQKEVYKYQ